MDSEQKQETWQVEANGKLFDTTFAEMTAWIDQGSLLRQDKVRKGNLRWIEAGRVPSLVAVFNAKENGQPLPPPVVTLTKMNPTQIPGESTSNAVNFTPAATVSVTDAAGPICSVHPDLLAAYVCGICNSSFCKACPNSYGGTVKICPLCGAMCKTLAQVEKVGGGTVSHMRASGESFGFGDIAKSFAYPFRFKTSLVLGAVMFMFFSICQSVVSFGGIYMLPGAIACFMLANTLTFGILANIVENFSKGELCVNFMPTFEEFSLWDDVVHPFFLSIGVYLSSFGPLAVVFVVAFFFIAGSAGDINGVQSDAARTVIPELPYAANAVKQSDRVKELLGKTADEQKNRVEAMERNEIPPDVTAMRNAAKDADDLNVERTNQLIQQQQKAQLESVVGKTPETVANERSELIAKMRGYGAGFMLIAAICLLWGLFYFPAACAVAGYTRSFSATLNPTVGLDTIRRLRFDYVKILLMFVAIALTSGFIGAVLSTILSAFNLPGVGNVPAAAVGSLFKFYFSIVFSCVIGYALYKSADRLKLPS